MNCTISGMTKAKLSVFRLEDRTTPAAVTPDAVLWWHDVLMDACVVDNSLNYVADQGGPTRGARAMAVVQGAVFDAVNSIDERFTPYLIDADEAPGASVDAAVAQAAHDTLVAMYPKQKATFDARLTEALAAVPSGKAEGVAVGAKAAAAMLKARATDGSGTSNIYVPGDGPLDWKPDPLHPAQKALTPDWGFVTPFTMTGGSQFRPPAPPDANSAEYLAAYNEVLRLGGDGVGTPTDRTDEQTEIGIFWGYDGQPGLCTPPRLYNQIVHQIAVERGNTMVQNARLLALVNLAQADAGVSSWEAKYFYSLARPVTAIREAANDGNAKTVGDVDWSPLGAPANNGSGTNFTPPFPAYVSGHATFGGAVFEVLRRFYGTDDIAFTFLSDELNGKTVDQFGETREVRPRSFQSLSQAEEENGQSRIYLGIHWAFDKTEGIKSGNRIADNAFDRFLRARPDTSHVVVAADTGAGPRVRVLDGSTGRAIYDFFAYDPKFSGGVRVAQGDVNGDGTPDIITAAGPGGGPHVRVYNGADGTPLFSFMAFAPDFRGGTYVASGDIDGDGFDDIVAGAGEGGGPRVVAFSGRTLTPIANFFALDQGARSGVHVAAGDVDGDGKAEMIASGGKGGVPTIRTFDSGGKMVREIAAYAADFRGGVFVAAGDCDGDGKADIVTGPGSGGGPRVRVFTGEGDELQNYFAFTPSTQLTTKGVHVACIDVNGDGRADLVAAAAAGDLPIIESRDAASLEILNSTFAFESTYLGGVCV